MTSGAAGSTRSSDIVGPVNSPLPLSMPMRPVGVTPSQFSLHWSATLGPLGVAAGLPGLDPGLHPDGQLARSQTGSHATRLANLKGGGF